MILYKLKSFFSSFPFFSPVFCHLSYPSKERKKKGQNKENLEGTAREMTDFCTHAKYQQFYPVESSAKLSFFLENNLKLQQSFSSLSSLEKITRQGNHSCGMFRNEHKEPGADIASHSMAQRV